MLFVDTKPTWKSLVLLILITLAIYSINISLNTLRNDEALVAAYAQDMTYASNTAPSLFGKISLKGTTLYGTPVKGFPLYPWLASLCSGKNFPGNTAMRLPACISLLLLALISGLFARKLQSSYAGIIAACIILLSPVSFKIGILASGDIVASLLLTTAWFTLFVLGWIKKKWRSAWIVSLLLVLIASMIWGIKAYILFYLPLCFLWNKLDGFEIMQAPPHLIAAIASIIILFLRGTVFPTTPLLPWKALAFANAPESFGGYCMHIVSMLPKIAYYLFPWTLLAWAPFCLEMRQFEKHRVACHYLRVIVSSCFVFYLLMPGGKPLNLLPAFGPFAVLIGIHSEIVLRRHRDFFSSLLRLSLWLISIAAIIGIIYWCRLDFNDTNQIYFSLGCLLIALFSIIFSMLIYRSACSFRSCAIWVIFSISMLHTSLYRIPKALQQRTIKNYAATLSTGIIKNAPETLQEAISMEDTARELYLYAPPNLAEAGKYLTVNFYLHTHIKYIRDMQELPREKKIVYVMSPYIPSLQDREWHDFSKEITLSPKTAAPSEAPPTLKIYQGIKISKESGNDN